MNRNIDLHIHTNCSDGILSPEEVLEKVRELKLAAFAITDHDTIDGYLKIRELIKEGDPELIPGVEFSVAFEEGDLHLLAYYFDPENLELRSSLEEFQANRNNRAIKMVEKLNELGVDITYQMVKEIALGNSIGRPHIAQAMFNIGAVKEFDAAFGKYIGNGKPAYVPKKYFTPEEAIFLIRKAGGVSVMAHPVIENNERFLDKMVKLGMDGVEITHPYHQKRDTDRLRSYAERFRLIVSGGSDFHGREDKYGGIGSQKVPLKYLDEIKRIANRRREAN